MLKWILLLFLLPNVALGQYFHRLPNCFGQRSPSTYTILTQPGLTYSYEVTGGSIVEQTSETLTIDWYSDGLLTVTAVNEWDCITQVSLTLQFVPCDQSMLWVPNAFTPGENRINDRFAAIGINISQFQMSIFNRWGEEIWFTRNINAEWDGQYKGKICMQGIYSYKITYDDHQGYAKTLVGMVTLIR
jgi:gliding motility-associated-like protein